MRCPLPDAGVERCETAPRPPALMESQEPCHGAAAQQATDSKREFALLVENEGNASLLFRPTKCMLLQQTVYFMGKIRPLSKIPARPIDSKTGRFLLCMGLFSTFYLESAAFLFHMSRNPVNRIARAGVNRKPRVLSPTHGLWLASQPTHPTPQTRGCP
jgi:hypothetical protein